jgi:hypothetical protein
MMGRVLLQYYGLVTARDRKNTVEIAMGACDREYTGAGAIYRPWIVVDLRPHFQMA